MFHHQTPNFGQLVLTSSLFAVKMASDKTPSSKCNSSVILIVISNFCFEFFHPSLLINKQIEGWPTDQVVVRQKQQNRLYEKQCQIDEVNLEKKKRHFCFFSHLCSPWFFIKWARREGPRIFKGSFWNNIWNILWCLSYVKYLKKRDCKFFVSLHLPQIYFQIIYSGICPNKNYWVRKVLWSQSCHL